MSNIEGFLNDGTRIIQSKWDLASVPYHSKLRIDARVDKVGHGIDNTMTKLLTLVSIELRFVREGNEEVTVAEIYITSANEYTKIDENTPSISDESRKEILRMSMINMIQEIINELVRIGKVSKVDMPDMTVDLFLQDALDSVNGDATELNGPRIDLYQR